MTATTSTTAVGAVVAGACQIAIAKGPGDGTSGSSYFPINFTNTGANPCQLTGGASAQYLAVDRQTGIGPVQTLIGGTTLLQPGQSVSATLRLIQDGVIDDNACDPIPAVGIRIVPPAAAAPSIVSGNAHGCGKGGDLSWYNSLPTPDGGPG